MPPKRRKKKILLTAAALLAAAAAAFLIPTIWLKPWSIDHFYGRVFLAFALRHPMMLSGLRVLEPMGLDFHSDDLDDVSLEFQRREAAWVDKQLEILGRYDREALDGDEARLSYDVLEFFLEDLVRGRRFLFHNYPVDQMSGAHTMLPDFMINTHQIHDDGDAKSYLERLEKFGPFFDQVIAGLEYRRQQGIVPPRFVLEKSLDQVRELTAPAARENPLFEYLAEQAGAIEGLEEEDRERLLGRAAGVIEGAVYPAYGRLAATLESHLEVATGDHGVWKLPDGEAFYAHQLRHYTTTEMSAEEIHRLGLEQVASIEGEMREILVAEGVEATEIGAAMESLIEDERFRHPDGDTGRQQIREEFRAIIAEVDAGIGELFDLRPQAEVAVERVPEFKQEGAPGAYYESPPFDGSKPGTFYVNLANVEDHPRYGMRTLAYHEAIPGHHFQRTLAQEMEGVPFFRRIVPFTAYTEGWALYAEQLAAEHGFQDDPFDRLGYLQAQLFRAVRLVVDTGIHQRRWTREQAIEYMSSHTGMPPSEVVTEIERYIVLPGQACAYKVGQLKIVELRQRAREALGPRFDLRRFHNVLLGHGAVPLTLLEELVDRWIAEEQT